MTLGIFGLILILNKLKRAYNKKVLSDTWQMRGLYSSIHGASFLVKRTITYSYPTTQASCDSLRESTIFNIATPPGVSGVAVFRISGPEAYRVLDTMTKKPEAFIREPRKLISCALYENRSKERLLDLGMAVWFPRPRSFTGEDVVELHLHGGPSIVRSVSAALASISPKFRPSLPGEFVRRAFDNNKMDLPQVEGLHDLLSAQTDMQHNNALKQLQGTIRTIYNAWREDLIKCLAQLEAWIDFGEEEELDQNSKNFGGMLKEIYESLESIDLNISQHLKHASTMQQIIQNGIHVTIAGPPNAGKSTLLNWIAKREAAIVSPIPGTTRDVISINCHIGGHSVNFYDTAGIYLNNIDSMSIQTNTDKEPDPVELIGISKSKEYIRTCHICIFVLDGSVSATNLLSVQQQWESIAAHTLPACPFFILVNKLDDPNDPACKANLEISPTLNHLGTWSISLKTFYRVQDWLEALSRHISTIYSQDKPMDHSFVNSIPERHKYHLEQCLYHIQRAKVHLLSTSMSCVLAAEEQRHAARHLGQVTGSDIVHDQVLDAIFQRFCIGK